MSEICPYEFEAWFSQEGFQENSLINCDRAMELVGQLREFFRIDDITRFINGICILVNNQELHISYWKDYKIWLGHNSESGQEFILTSLTDLILVINESDQINIIRRNTIITEISKHVQLIHRRNLCFGWLRIGNKDIYIVSTNSLQGPEYYILNQSNPDFNRPIFMSKKKKAIINYLIHNIRRPVN